MSEVFKRRTRVGAPAEEVFGWHARPGALERLTPPFSPVEVVERNGGIADRARVVLKIPLGPTHVRWVAEHQDYIEGRQFRDVQVEGPFARWKHTHRFEPDGPHASFLEDRIDYALPFGAAGALVGGPFVRDMLDRMFTYRHHTTVEDIATHAAYPGGPLHIAVSGSTGLVGSALIPFLTTGGHRVTRLVRSTPVHPDAEVRWDPTAGTIDAAQLEGINAIVHLAGENIAAGRWTEATKARIKESRLRGTRLLCESAARLQRPPKVLVCASAIGYYGDRGATVVDEDSPPGTGFLAEVCSEWEAATAAARASGIRVVQMRLGVVLTAAGGALAKLLLPFQLGTGGRLGSGEQYMSWVSLDDVIGAILHALRTDVLEGPVNAVAPHPVTNQEFTKTLGRVLRRPTVFPVPAMAARFAFGEMADEMLLAGARVAPTRLAATHYAFRHADLEAALRHTLGKTRRGGTEP